jgi:hypothetical protein
MKIHHIVVYQVLHNASTFVFFFCTPKQGRQKKKFKEDKKQIFMLVKGQIKNLKNISQK